MTWRERDGGTTFLWERQRQIKWIFYGLQKLIQRQMKTSDIRNFGGNAQWNWVCSETAAVLKESPGMCKVCNGVSSWTRAERAQRALHIPSRADKLLSDWFTTNLPKWMHPTSSTANPPTFQHLAVSQVHLGMHALGAWIIEWMCETVIKKLNWSEPWSRLLCFVFLTHQDFFF